MRKKFLSTEKRYSKKSKPALLLLALFFGILLLFSRLYPAFECDHDCSGEDCAVCAIVSVCETIQEELPVSLEASVFSFAPLFFVASICLLGQILRVSTPITLKDKISD